MMVEAGNSVYIHVHVERTHAKNLHVPPSSATSWYGRSCTHMYTVNF